MIKRRVAKGAGNAVVQPWGSSAPHLSAGEESRWPNICSKHFAVSFQNSRNKELKGGSWIALWWLKVSRRNCKSKRWGSWQSFWNIDISDAEKVDRDKNKFKITGLNKGILNSLGLLIWILCESKRKDFQELAVPKRLSSKATDTGCPSAKVS